MRSSLFLLLALSGSYFAAALPLTDAADNHRTALFLPQPEDYHLAAENLQAVEIVPAVWKSYLASLLKGLEGVTSSLGSEAPRMTDAKDVWSTVGANGISVLCSVPPETIWESLKPALKEDAVDASLLPATCEVGNLADLKTGKTVGLAEASNGAGADLSVNYDVGIQDFGPSFTVSVGGTLYAWTHAGRYAIWSVGTRDVRIGLSTVHIPFVCVRGDCNELVEEDHVDRTLPPLEEAGLSKNQWASVSSPPRLPVSQISWKSVKEALETWDKTKEF